MRLRSKPNQRRLVRAHRGGEIPACAGTAPKPFRDPEADRRIQDLRDAVPLDQFQEAAAGLRCPGPVVMVHSTANVDAPSPGPLGRRVAPGLNRAGAVILSLVLGAGLDTGAGGRAGATTG
jgi:hypothetical protein